MRVFSTFGVDGLTKINRGEVYGSCLNLIPCNSKILHNESKSLSGFLDKDEDRLWKSE